MKLKKIQTKKLIAAMMILTILILPIFAISQEGLEAGKALENAGKEISEMQERGISTSRVNETFNEAKEKYLAQKIIDEQNKNADYSKIIEYTEEISKIKETSFQAQDELEIFVETYQETSKKINLSEMKGHYNKTIKSLNDERFEETIELIDEGYQEISEIESQQTALKAFYSSTYETIKTFITTNWKILSAIFVILIVFFLSMKKTLKRIKIRRKLKKLEFRKKVLNHLIAKLQKEYFENKGSNETEYTIRIEQFKKMIRDINREIPTLREEIEKTKTKESSKKSDKNGRLLQEKLSSMEREIRNKKSQQKPLEKKIKNKTKKPKKKRKTLRKSLKKTKKPKNKK